MIALLRLLHASFALELGKLSEGQRSLGRLAGHSRTRTGHGEDSRGDCPARWSQSAWACDNQDKSVSGLAVAGRADWSLARTQLHSRHLPVSGYVGTLTWP